jgi:SOS-response transcriptional repressor LexA
MLNVGSDLKTIRKKMGKSQREIAVEFGLPQTTWASYETGKASPSMEILFKLAEMGYPIKGLTTSILDDMAEDGKISKAEFQRRLEIARAFPPEMPIDDFSKAVEAADKNPKPISDFSLFKFSHGKPVPVSTHETDPDAMVLIPVFSQRAAAGQGQPPSQLAEIESYIPIVLEMLGGAHPRCCGIVRVIGDSMTDMTLFNGDLVIFDRSQIEGDGVYVISIGTDVRVKRLEYRPFERKIIISSENAKRYPDPEVISYEQAETILMIHGKVICWMHKHPY